MLHLQFLRWTAILPKPVSSSSELVSVSRTNIPNLSACILDGFHYSRIPLLRNSNFSSSVRPYFYVSTSKLLNVSTSQQLNAPVCRFVADLTFHINTPVRRYFGGSTHLSAVILADQQTCLPLLVQQSFSIIPKFQHSLNHANPFTD